MTHVYPKSAQRWSSSRIGVRASAILVVVVSVTLVVAIVILVVAIAAMASSRRRRREADRCVPSLQRLLARLKSLQQVKVVGNANVHGDLNPHILARCRANKVMMPTLFFG